MLGNASAACCRCHLAQKMAATGRTSADNSKVVASRLQGQCYIRPAGPYVSLRVLASSLTALEASDRTTSLRTLLQLQVLAAKGLGWRVPQQQRPGTARQSQTSSVHLQVAAARQREEALQQQVDSSKAELESLLQRERAATERGRRLQVGLGSHLQGPMGMLVTVRRYLQRGL